MNVNAYVSINTSQKKNPLLIMLDASAIGVGTVSVQVDDRDQNQNIW